MNIGVVGLRKLGICPSVLFSKHLRAHGTDMGAQRICQISNRERFSEPRVNEYLEKYGKNWRIFYLPFPITLKG
jgi:UDP-N-acetyl-D-mannosaminuronate dehydrogenase